MTNLIFCRKLFSINKEYCNLKICKFECLPALRRYGKVIYESVLVAYIATNEVYNLTMLHQFG